MNISLRIRNEFSYRAGRSAYNLIFPNEGYNLISGGPRLPRRTGTSTPKARVFIFEVRRGPQRVGRGASTPAASNCVLKQLQGPLSLHKALQIGGRR
ncbi:hypothetical protein EVAR_65501_1 [Eumeta japonica]|uniref:Uncharacterized protein n=1 Tax=Eumeta variegata TaxID=151549 RepID=A0A4C2AA45_EUMVA|nr:hypothetical protein EVAR_65501_1 [Eumeta japonica]